MANEAALLKRVYGDMSDPIAPEGSIAELVPFSMRDKIGEYYVVPVRLGLEQGVTYNNDHTAFPMNTAVSGVYEQALVSGSEILNRAQLSYGNMARLSKAKGNTKEAYDQDLALKIVNMVQGAEMHRETALLYGPGPNSTIAGDLGAVAYASAAAGGKIAIACSRLSSNPGFWQDALGMKVQFTNAAGTALVISSGVLQVTATGSVVNSGYFTLTEVTVGAAAALATALGALVPPLPGAVANALRIIPYGAYQVSMVGISGILQNGSATLFNISGSTYPQWRGVTYNVNGTFNFDDFANGVARVANNKLKTGGTLLLGNNAWTSLLNDEVALRRWLGKDQGGLADTGFDEISFTTQVGKTTIRPYAYLKQGDACFLANKKWGRYGATDLTNTLPGNPDEWFFKQNDTTAGAEIRTYGDMAIFTDTPFHSIWFYGITSAADVVQSAVIPVIE